MFGQSWQAGADDLLMRIMIHVNYTWNSHEGLSERQNNRKSCTNTASLQSAPPPSAWPVSNVWVTCQSVVPCQTDPLLSSTRPTIIMSHFWLDNPYAREHAREHKTLGVTQPFRPGPLPAKIRANPQLLEWKTENESPSAVNPCVRLPEFAWRRLLGLMGERICAVTAEQYCRILTPPNYSHTHAHLISSSGSFKQQMPLKERFKAPGFKGLLERVQSTHTHTHTHTGRQCLA